MGKRKAEATDEKRAADEKPKKARKAEATDAKRKTDEKPKKARWRDRTPRTVLISNLARTTSSSGLRELVEEYADVADVRIMKSTTGKKKSASIGSLSTSPAEMLSSTGTSSIPTEVSSGVARGG